MSDNSDPQNNFINTNTTQILDVRGKFENRFLRFHIRFFHLFNDVL